MEMKPIATRMAALVLAAIVFLPQPVGAVSAEHAILMDGTTGRVLYEKSADQQSLIASTTKIMTALIVCEQCNVLDRMRIPREAVGIEGSSMYLREGEVLTVQDLLYGLMLQSGNDAAVALAIYCGGTVEGFVALMNEKATRLGLSNTQFENPNGLDAPHHYSSARDLAVLASYAMENPIFAKTVSTKSVKIGERYLTNHNKLLWRIDGADGVKTGFTKKAGRILVSSACRKGRRLICVTINDGDDWRDHQKLLEEGFEKFSVRDLVAAGDTLGACQVLDGQGSQVHLLAGEDFSYALADKERVQILLPAPGFVYAPVVRGQKAGFAHILVDGKAVGKVPLLYGETVEKQKEPERSFWQKLLEGDWND